MIRLLEDSEPKKLKRYDTVKYAGYDWYIIYLDKNYISLLAKGADFGKRRFNDAWKNDYKTSDIRKYLNSEINYRLVMNGAKPVPAKLPDGEVDRVWLLSTKEAEALPDNIRKFPDPWWLRSRASTSERAEVMDTDGKVSKRAFDGHVNNKDNAVRPVIMVKPEDLQQALEN